MCHFHQLWGPRGAEEMNAGMKAVEDAQAKLQNLVRQRGVNAPSREQAYVDAIRQYFEHWQVFYLLHMPANLSKKCE